MELNFFQNHREGDANRQGAQSSFYFAELSASQKLVCRDTINPGCFPSAFMVAQDYSNKFQLMPTKYSVLISYSKDDQLLAEKVLKILTSRGITCWTAFQNLEAGQIWPAAINDAINECDIFLLILTRNSNTSLQVVRELTQADYLHKRLYCFQVEDISISPNIHYFFSAIHRHEAFQIDFEKSLVKLADDIERQLRGQPGLPIPLTPPPPPPPPPPTRRALIRMALAAIALGITLLVVMNARNIRRLVLGPRIYVVDPGLFRLSVNQRDHFEKREFTVKDLDLRKDFLINFEIKSIKNGGSTRYGIAWNYQPDDFLLFTLHSIGGKGAYSIGRGNSRTSKPWAYVTPDGNANIKGEGGFDKLGIKKRGDRLIFMINDLEVWRTTDYRLLSNSFAFWVADFSEALMRAYSLDQ